MNSTHHHNWITLALISTIILAGCSNHGVSVVPNDSTLDAELRSAINSSQPQGLASLIMPQEHELDLIPQDPANTLSAEKVALGKMLYHDTALASPTHAKGEQSWSCATCHHAAAGFKAGIPQGIGEGGSNFGLDGSKRVLASGFSALATLDSGNKPDLQPLATPTVLNAAYQDVMLWNGQFGNSSGGINSSVDSTRIATANTPKVENLRQLSGLETQAIAGLAVHRIDTTGDYVLNQNAQYRQLYRQAFGSLNTDDYQRDAGLAIAAYERTVLATEAPFQQWLRGDRSAMSDSQKRGATLFFGKAACSDCHQGPALSSMHGASESELFFAIGMNDFDVNHAQVHGSIAPTDSQGRGGFTGNPQDMFKFKIPQLYNLTDSTSLGHGASFSSIKNVIEYKNNAVAQNPQANDYLDPRFRPLSLTGEEINDLTDFLTDGLYDANLERYAPASVPSGACVVVAASGGDC